MGFGVPFITWVMSSLTYVSLFVLINGVDSSLFQSGRRVRQVCPLAPLLFLVVAEGLSRALLFAKNNGIFRASLLEIIFH